jgi:hypothetical protein
MENTLINDTIIDNKKSIKIWSENLQRFYYKSKDPNYYNDYFHKTKHPMQCEICNKIITCQMYSHKKSKKCKMKAQEIEIERLNLELKKLQN